MGKKRKKKKNIVFKIFATLCIIIAIIAGLAVGVCKAKYNGEAKKMFQDVSSIIFGNAEKVNILLVGISDDINAELADTIMVCGYDPENQNAYMLSIPRDTFVGNNVNNAGASNKINSRYQKGISTLKKDVENLTGIELNYYVVVKT